MAQTLVTDSNLTPVVQIVTWFLLTTSISGVIARGLTKANIIRSIDLDDALVSIALVFSIGQSVAVSIQTTNGFGKPATTLSQQQVMNDLKAEYAASLFYIPTLCFSKLAVLALLRRFTPALKEKRLLYGITLFIILWAISAEFAAAFACRPVKPYDYLTEKCFSRTAWLNYLEATNIATDVILIILPIVIIWKVKTTFKRKVSVLSFFSLRLVVISASISKLVFWNRIHDIQDPTFEPWPVAVCTQTIQCLEILAACVLYLRPLLMSLESGFISGADLRRRGEVSTDGSTPLGQGYPLADRKPRGIAKALTKLSRSGNNTMISRVDPESELGSQHSRSQIIRETRTWGVETSAADENRISRERSDA